VTVEHLRDLAGMCGIEFLAIDDSTELEAFRDRLRWNDVYHLLAKGI